MKFIYLGLFAIIGIFIAINIVRYNIDMNTAYKRINDLGSQLVETEYGTVEYALRGRGYPILVIHGSMGGFDQGLALADEFIDSNYQSICISRFGYLRSQLPQNPTITLQADAYNSLLDAINVPKVAVFGTSGGANSAIRFAACHPERVSALILLSPAAPGKEMPATPPKAVFDKLLRSDFIYWASVKYSGSSMYSFIGVPKNFKLTSALESEIQGFLMDSMLSSRRMDGMIFDMYTSSDEFYQSVTEKSPYPLGKIKIPVLVINAKDDPLALPENVRCLAGMFPNSRLFVVPNGGHELLGHTQEVKLEISKFLSENLKDTRY